jgi:dolichol-phosphate mannosyltransferase
MRAGRAFTSAQAAAAAVVLARFARGRRRRPPLTAGPAVPAPDAAISVVVPARDEATRLMPCLEGLRGDPDVAELLVVDDRSSDATAEVASAGGARVLPGAPLPAGWAGKAWALHQGTGAASGEWILFLDADTRPRPGLARALVALALAEDADLVSAGPRFLCHGAAERLLHPAMAATIAYRAGPSDVPGRQPSPARAIVNGQCLLVRRRAFAAWGGWERVRGHLTEDVALARALRGDGRRVAFADAADLLDVRMYEGARETWSGWGRSLMGPDVNGPLRQAEDLAVLWLALALPLPRVLLRRGTPLDLLLLAVRLGITAALARSYRPRGAPFWLSPLADVPVMGRLTWSVLRPDRTWRGRTY